jgi:glycosyltransferase involved in cell wall biosynthesis
VLLTHFPKISCILVTAPGRLEYFKRSLNCYTFQTYPNRELVIVNDGPKEYQQDIKELVKHRNDVRCIFLNEKYTLGALRNIGIGLCFGDIFVQWDDDDFNAPERLATQVGFLLKNSEAKVCFLTDQLHFFFPTKQLFWNNWWENNLRKYKRFALVPGTIMAYTKDFYYHYPSYGTYAAAGEDSVLTDEICTDMLRKVLLIEEIGYLYCYSFHGKNVWDIEHHLHLSKTRAMSRQYLISYRERICRTLKYLQLADTVYVTGSDGLAFTYDI